MGTPKSAEGPVKGPISPMRKGTGPAGGAPVSAAPAGSPVSPLASSRALHAPAQARRPKPKTDPTDAPARLGKNLKDT